MNNTIEFTKEEIELLLNIINTVPLNGNYEQLQSLLPVVTSILTKLGGLNYDNSK